MKIILIVNKNYKFNVVALGFLRLHLMLLKIKIKDNVMNAVD